MLSSFIMRPKIGKRARVWCFYSFASFPLFFFKSHSYSRGALRAWADQFNASQRSCRRHRRRLCSTYLLFSFSVKFQLSPSYESEVASPAVIHLFLSCTFSQYAPSSHWFHLFQEGGGTARSQASFPNSRHWCFVLFLSLFFLILKVVTVLTTHAFLTAENKGLSFTEMVLPSNLFHARSLVSFNVDLKYTN